MASGGRRPGSGRKPGAATRKTREAADLIAASGITPLGYMQGLLDGTQQYDQIKFEAAKAAAPYVHARLAAVEHSGAIGTRRADDVTDDELADIAAGSGDSAAKAPLDPSQFN